ncbi:MAG: ABC transporter permease [Candidatus Bathyarchaeota archaeon]|nr:ABC transporter permease [Candidatus Bathyarchaeota archaeon]
MATRKARTAFMITRFRRTLSQISRSKRGTIGIVIIVFFVLVGILAPVIAPYDPISPWRGVGEYPAYGEELGPKLTDTLCYPTWYKYLPWVYKGPIENIETFYNSYLNVPEINETFQLFGLVGENTSKNYLPLSLYAAEPKRVSATFPNNTVRDLTFEEEWSWDLAYRDQIKILKDLPGGTFFEATYLTGSDIVETIEVVPDHMFSSEQIFKNDWQWKASSPDLINTQYNSQKGFKNDGCVEISYSPKPEEPVPEGEVNVVMSKSFEYQYWESPKSFLLHMSIHVEASTLRNVNITIMVRNNSKNQTFLITSFLATNIKEGRILDYVHTKEVSTSAQTRQNVGFAFPEQVIFSMPANMSLVIGVDFLDKEKDTTVYIDHLNMIIYGNAFGLLGTDNGNPIPPRDIFSTLVHGTRVSLIVGVLSALFSTIIGLFLGLTAGYIGGIVDEGIMRFADLLLVLPTLPLFIVLIAVMKATYGLVSMWNIIILITFFGWMSFSRSVRSMVLSIRERPFIEAAKAAGAGKFYIITKHIIPNVFTLVYVTLATSVPGAIIYEASLSWLGLGDRTIPSWGKVLYDFNASGIAVTKGLTEYWFWIFPPCIAIALLATAFILLGFSLDEILNPRLRERR